MVPVSSSRVPHGTRGLKFDYLVLNQYNQMSRPAWDAWIEIIRSPSSIEYHSSRPAWDAWIEMQVFGRYSCCRGSRVPHGTRGLKSDTNFHVFIFCSSRPAWDAWIEILTRVAYGLDAAVASRMGRVD